MNRLGFLASLTAPTIIVATPLPKPVQKPASHWDIILLMSSLDLSGVFAQQAKNGFKVPEYASLETNFHADFSGVDLWWTAHGKETGLKIRVHFGAVGIDKIREGLLEAAIECGQDCAARCAPLVTFKTAFPTDGRFTGSSIPPQPPAG